MICSENIETHDDVGIHITIDVRKDRMMVLSVLDI